MSGGDQCDCLPAIIHVFNNIIKTTGASSLVASKTNEVQQLLLTLMEDARVQRILKKMVGRPEYQLDSIYTKSIDIVNNWLSGNNK